MSYKTILVCLTHEATAERLTKAACKLARKFDAHLIALHAKQAMHVHPGIAMQLTPEIVQAFNHAQSLQVDAIHDIFLKEAGKENLIGEWRLVDAAPDQAGQRLVEHALCADLIVMSQADQDFERDQHADLLRDVILGSGLPVLVIPRVGEFENFGHKAMIAWSATREAARALHNAIPFVQDGGEAIVMWVAYSDKNAESLSFSANQAAANLDRHGVKVSVSHWRNSDVAIGDALLNEAFESGADMIVSGAFGHSRFYDFVIGATTTHLLEQMTLPILFSH